MCISSVVSSGEQLLFLNGCILFCCSINMMNKLTFGWTKLVLITIHKKHTTITASHFVIHLVVLVLHTNGVVLVRSWVAMSSSIANLKLSSKVWRFLSYYVFNRRAVGWQNGFNACYCFQEMWIRLSFAR